jgi:hypothetical protein
MARASKFKLKNACQSILNRSTHSKRMLRALVVASVALCVHAPGGCITTLAAAGVPSDSPQHGGGDSEAHWQGNSEAARGPPSLASAAPTFVVDVELPSSPGVASPISFTQGSSVPATVAQFVQAHAAELHATGHQLSLEGRMVSPACQWVSVERSPAAPPIRTRVPHPTVVTSPSIPPLYPALRHGSVHRKRHALCT